MNFLAYLFAVLKNVIYGSTVFIIGDLTATNHVLDVLAFRYLTGFVVFWLLKTLNIVKIDVGAKDILLKTKRAKYMKGLLLTALFEPILYMLCETTAISMASDITTGVILSLSPVAAMIAENVILKERTTWAEKILLVIGIAGVMYIAVNTDTSGGSQDSVMGIMLLFGAVISGVLFCVFSRQSSSKFTSMEITYFACMIGAIGFNTINVVRHLFMGDILSYFAPYMSLSNLFGFFFLGVVATIVATLMNNYALSKIQVSTMASFSGLSTLVTILLGIWLHHEKLYLFQIIGLVLILVRMIGVSLISIQRQKKTTTLLFVRHGQSEANLAGVYVGQTESPLSQMGREQAEKTAEYLAENYRVDKVYASDLSRAFATGQTIAEKLGVEIEADKKLREINAGSWEGVPFEELLKDDAAYQVWMSDIGSAACPNGETVAQLQERFVTAVQNIAAENPGKTVVIATHATPIRSLQCHCSGKGIAYMQEIKWVPNASVTVAKCEDGIINLREIGCDDHLEGLHSELPASV